MDVAFLFSVVKIFISIISDEYGLVGAFNGIQHLNEP